MKTHAICSDSGIISTNGRLAFLVSLILATSPFNRTFCQWQSFDRPCADFRALAVMDSTIYAFGSPCAIHASTDNGRSWSIVKWRAPMNNTGFCLGALDGQLLAGTNEGAYLWKSVRRYSDKQAIAGAADDIQAVGFVKRGTDYKYFLGGFGCGVRRSTDSCTTWTLTNEGLTNLNVTSLATTTATGDTNPVLYAGTYGGGVFRSDNDGTSWIASNNGLDNLLVYAIAADKGTLYTAHGGGRVSQFLDIGGTWAQVGAGLPHTDVISLALVAVEGMKYIYAGTIDAGIWRYDPHDDTWMPMNTGLKSLRINSIVIKDSFLFVATDRGIFRSPDFGSSWQLTSETATPLVSSAYAASFSSGVPATRLFVVTDYHYYNKNIYAGGVGLGDCISAVCWTDDLGQTWTTTPFRPNFISTYERFEYFAFQLNDCIFLFNTGVGEYDHLQCILSTDRGASWGDLVDMNYFAHSGLNGALLRGVPSERRFEMYIGLGGGPNSGLWRSLDSGKTWTELKGPFGFNLHGPIYIQDSTLYARYANPVRSTDMGVTWDVLDYKGCFSPVGKDVYTPNLILVHSNAEWLFANVAVNAAPGEPGGLYASSDHGETWIPAGFRGGMVDRVVESGGILYALQGAHAYASKPHTFLWKDVTGELISDSLVVITASPEYLFAIAKASDRLWYRPVSDVEALLGEVPIQPSLVAPVNGTTYDSTAVLLRWSPTAFSSSYRLQLSEDGAFSSPMTIDSISLLDTTYRTLPLTKNHLYYWRVCALNFNGSGPWSATYHFTVSPTATSVATQEVPKETALLQNYPNPFNPVTKIGFRVSGLGSRVVKLIVYDLLGREVAVLVDEKREPGNYAEEFNARNLASGVYVYRMQVGGFVQTRKMLVVR
jgi:hypothetical protein